MAAAAAWGLQIAGEDYAVGVVGPIDGRGYSYTVTLKGELLASGWVRCPNRKAAKVIAWRIAELVQNAVGGR